MLQAAAETMQRDPATAFGRGPFISRPILLMSRMGLVVAGKMDRGRVPNRIGIDPFSREAFGARSPCGSDARRCSKWGTTGGSPRRGRSLPSLGETRAPSHHFGAG
jgi:hypothetical protein